MESKTPKFDALLDQVLEKLVPHTQVCKWKGKHPHCEGDFELSKRHIDFLKIFKVPPPNYCPTCRRVLRFVHMGNLRLFKRSCEVPGHKEMLISIFPEECPFPVYDYKYYIGDKFDALSFGINSNIYQSNMLDTLYELRKKFPLPSFLNRDPNSVGSEYSNGGRNLKNGYYTMGCFESENVWYSTMAYKSKNIMDSSHVEHSEYVYASCRSEGLYKSSWIYFSKDCIDSMFLFDCRNCSSCFGCVNLRNAKNCIFNVQYSESEYAKFIQNLYPLSREKLSEYEDKFWDLIKNSPVNASRNLNSLNSTGVMLIDSKNVEDCIDSDRSVNIIHCDATLSLTDSMDVLYSGGHSSLLYNTVNVGSQSSNTKFSYMSKFVQDSEFVFNCNNIKNCFMCFGLRDKTYCILNTQYEKEEYFKIVDDIKHTMLMNGEYGDSLPFKFSGQCYNFSIAQNVFPLEEQKVTELSGYIAREPESNAGDSKILRNNDIPKCIDLVSNEILNFGIECKESGRPFRITQSELEFYRQMKIPLPDVHPSIRMQKHFKLVQVGQKAKINCAKCGVEVYSAFNQNTNLVKQYCEKCYQQEVY